MMRRRFSNAFTLLELLAVMGVIALMAGAAGLFLPGDKPGIALQSAQGTLAGLLSVARGQAVLNQRRTTLMVDADSRSDGFLRDIRIAVQARSSPEEWVQTGEGARLPRGVYVVPGPALSAGVKWETGSGKWPAGRRSTLQMVAHGSMALHPGDQAGAYLMMNPSLGFAGETVGGDGTKLILAMARRTPEGLIFSHPEWVCGVVLSSYGLPIFINYGTGFDF